jgi:hypothetical protein
MKIIIFIFLIAGALAKGCAKILSKNSDEITLYSGKVLINSSRILARQYIKNDTTISDEDMRNWNDTTLTNYFLLDLSKLEEQISKTTDKDIKLKNRVLRNYKWLEKNNASYTIKIFSDTTNNTKNMELKKGAKYFVKLYMIKNYTEFQESFRKEQKILKDHIKKNKIREDLIYTEYYYRSKYYPLHEELLGKILNETDQ